MINLMEGDALELMKFIPGGSVDAVICDPPYGTLKGIILKGWDKKTSVWDKIINHKEMLEQCNRILRVNGALVLFSQDPYTYKISSETHGNLPFSYRMMWLKDHFASPLSSKKAPVNYTEDICVFFKKYDMLNQHPLRDYTFSLFKFIGKTKAQLFEEMGHQGVCHFMRYDSTQFGLCTEKTYINLIEKYSINKMDDFIPYCDLAEIDRTFKRTFNLPKGKKFKSNVLEYKKDYTGLHPTQKPILLMEDLIKTYTNKGDTVLDFCLGSGTTGRAARNLGRDFIGIELDKKYYNIARDRIMNNPPV